MTACACVPLRARALPSPYPELLALLVLAGALNLWALSINGWANEYYAGAVRSMAASWHAFLYGSLDASGRDDRRQAAAGAVGAGAVGARVRLELAGACSCRRR